MNRILGFDENLGLPQHFAKKTALQIKPYHDLGLMIRDFEQGPLTCLFLPVGTLPYLKKNYYLIAQALFGNTQTLTAVLTSAMYSKTLPSSISSLIFGRINPYCTTSFWGLLIYLMEKTAAGLSVQFKETQGFQDLLIKTAHQAVDASMIWEPILNTNKEEASKLSYLGTITGLPTPVIIAKEPLLSTLNHSLTHFQSNDNQSFFNGFCEADEALVGTFLEKMQQATTHFALEPRLYI